VYLLSDLPSGVTGEVHHVDCGYHVVGMKNPDAPDIAIVNGQEDPRRMMSHNTFGHLFRVTTWGESHGPAIGCVVDGCPPRMRLSEATSSPGSTAAGRASRASPPSARSPTRCASCPACSTGVTTGTPIALLIDNVDQRSRDYSAIAAQFRPGHAD
jgi:hypothetical protein